jgi:hypothetical protein
VACSLSTARSSSLTLLAIGWAVPGGPINAKKPSASRECRQRCEEERVAVRRRRAGHLYADRAGRAGRNILSPSEMIPIAHNKLIMHKVDYEVHFGPVGVDPDPINGAEPGVDPRTSSPDSAAGGRRRESTSWRCRARRPPDIDESPELCGGRTVCFLPGRNRG